MLLTGLETLEAFVFLKTLSRTLFRMASKISNSNSITSYERLICNILRGKHANSQSTSIFHHQSKRDMSILDERGEEESSLEKFSFLSPFRVEMLMRTGDIRTDNRRITIPRSCIRHCWLRHRRREERSMTDGDCPTSAVILALNGRPQRPPVAESRFVPFGRAGHRRRPIQFIPLIGS